MLAKGNKIDGLLNGIYRNKWLLMRYFASALVCGVIRYLINGVFIIIFKQPVGDAALLSWCVWTLIFYPCLKFFVFRFKSSDVYRLLRQIMIYILVCAVLWVTRQLFVSVLYVLTSNQTAALSVGGAMNELLCLWASVKIVFRKK